MSCDTSAAEPQSAAEPKIIRKINDLVHEEAQQRALGALEARAHSRYDASSMPDSYHDDPTVPPPGRRSGTGVGSIFPFLKKSLAANPQVPAQPEDQPTAPQLDPPPQGPRIPRPRSGR
jgi:hypothetical protein